MKLPWSGRRVSVSHCCTLRSARFGSGRYGRRFVLEIDTKRLATLPKMAFGECVSRTGFEVFFKSMGLVFVFKS